MIEFLECETANRPYLLGRNPEKGDSVLYRPDCKLWSCPHCANVKAKQWAARARGAIREHDDKDWHFLTLTIIDQTYDLTRQVHIWRKAWDKLSKRLKRAVGRDWTYICIPELSPKTCRLHAHLIIDWDCGRDPVLHSRINRKGIEEWFWYSSVLHEHLRPSGLGYIYDLQPLESVEQGSYYVTKYIGKGLSEQFPKGFRRVRVSQGFPEAPPDDPDMDYVWQVIQVNASGRRQLLRVLLAGEIVREVGTSRPVTLAHPLIAGSPLDVTDYVTRSLDKNG